jgi:ABC-type transport system involved in multi-copper enzyme maturation permease subunit
MRDQFGRLAGLRMVDVEAVKTLSRSDPSIPATARAGGGDFFELTTAPTTATRLLWPHDASILFGLVPIETGVPLGFQLYFIESGLVIGIGGWVAILTSIIITAFFIPNMLRKGTVDLLLVKPVRRSTLLVYKYIGGLTFIFLNTAVAVGGVWLALSLRSGVWATGFLWTILILTFFFAILYAVSTLFGVLTQSPVAAILLTCGVWFFLFLVGLGYQLFEQARVREERRAARQHREPEPEKWFPKTVQAVHFVLPRTSDLGVLNGRLLSRELITANQLSGRELDQTRIDWGESLTVSAVFIAVILGLACWRFSAKDY